MNNAEYIARTAAVERGHKKGPPSSAHDRTGLFLNAFEAVTGHPLPPQATVLDFGCAVGYTVGLMLKRGFDTYGVDILEYWDKDRDLSGEHFSNPEPEVRERLRVATDHLPYLDDTFDLIVSDQVVEHVFDLPTALREQMRVLKPGGIAIHHFPKSNALIEGHTKLPITSMHQYHWYLALWSILGARNARQKGMPWREALASNEALFRTTHYLPNKEIIRIATNTGAQAYFLDHLKIATSRTALLYHRAQHLGFGPIVKPLLSAISLTQVLVLNKTR